VLTAIWWDIYPDIVEGIYQLTFGPCELQEFAQINPPVQAVPLHIKEIGTIKKQGEAHTNPSP
jgi:hypothetical protein